MKESAGTLRILGRSFFLCSPTRYYGANRMHSMTMSQSLIRCEGNNAEGTTHTHKTVNDIATSHSQIHTHTQHIACVMNDKATNCLNNVRNCNMANIIQLLSILTLCILWRPKWHCVSHIYTHIKWEIHINLSINWYGLYKRHCFHASKISNRLKRNDI